MNFRAKSQPNIATKLQLEVEKSTISQKKVEKCLFTKPEQEDQNHQSYLLFRPKGEDFKF